MINNMKFRIFHSHGLNDNLFRSLLKFLPDIDEHIIHDVIENFNDNNDIVINNNKITYTSEKYDSGLFILSKNFIRMISLLDCYNKKSVIINICSCENFEKIKEFSNNNNYIIDYKYCSIDYLKCILIDNIFYIIDSLDYQIFFGNIKTIDINTFIRMNKIKKII